MPTLNTNDAKKDYILGHPGDYTFRKTMSSDSFFSYYSPAYVASNENLRWITEQTADNARHVLTTAASGDQALFYSINGAEKIDTFDISYCAKVILNIKIAAMQIMDYSKYMKLLHDLHFSPDAVSVPGMDQIINNIPSDCAKFLNEMRGCRIFDYGYMPDFGSECLPSYHEYEKMRRTVTKPLKFIWSDVSELHTQLSDTYDVINLSNIFDYMNGEQIFKVLESLRPYVRIGGTIIAQEGNFGITQKQNTYYKAAQSFKTWARLHKIRQYPNLVGGEEIAVLQRIR